ncbi:glycosyltransferase family 4 protein [Cellulomonas humilata]|uniref:D-inositol 3-phosphate glycosyltransferase n=1 Tax=Cellulomonas humilata TaxID=144055 RepID=A0ABU0EAI3_9CELL|nr:glycosyltransferase family 4 protein [Cellulomonas humilata]MDQ0372111.1 glycosyltransferase involved in cell wall biosynthesis [Cellulomonas humilata]
MNLDKSVLLLCKGFPPTIGGVETYSEEVARAYLGDGYAVTVLTQTSSPAGWSERDYPEGRLRHFNTGPGSQLQVFGRMLLAFRRAVREANPSWVHATTWKPALVHMAARSRLPVAVSVHGREVMNTPRPLRPAMRRVLRRSAGVVAVSTSTMAQAEKALGVPGPVGQWRVAPNGLTFDELARTSADHSRAHQEPVRLLSLARHIERKNIHGCLAALADIERHGSLDFEYRIAGSGPMTDELRQLVIEERLEHRVTFLGRVPDAEVPELYRWADVFLHPHTHVGEGNDFEGFGLVIADAMSFACVVVAGDVGGPTDFVRHGTSGLLVDGLDHRSLVDAIVAAAENSKSGNAMGRRARTHVLDTLSWHKHVGVVADAIGAAA